MSARIKLRWPKRLKHKSISQNTNQFPKTQVSFPKHKLISQNTNMFSKTQINFPKHKSISQNTNQFQKAGHYIIMNEMAWKEEWRTRVQGLSRPIWRLHVTRATLCPFSPIKMFCGHCGSVVKDTFKFCVKCGNSTSNNTETHSSTSIRPVVGKGELSVLHLELPHLI